MPLTGFEPAIPASKWLQKYVLDRAVTGIGSVQPYLSLVICCESQYTDSSCSNAERVINKYNLLQTSGRETIWVLWMGTRDTFIWQANVIRM